MVTKAVEKTLNIYPSEFGRTSYAWIIRAIFKAGLVIGWTTVISIFVERFSISALPALFMSQAVLTICGMLFFSFILDRFEVRWLVTGCGFAAALLLFGSTFYYDSNIIFFPMVLAASGIFLPQISIFLSNYIEDFFTPSECARTFPVIESAETIAGILGGLVLANNLPFFIGYKLIYIWVLLIFAFLAALYVFQPRTTSFYNYLYEMKILPVMKRMTLNGITKSLKEIKSMPFLQILIVVVFVQWFMAQLLEFQYTKIVDESLATGESGHAEGLSHGLGSLHMIFSASALVVQLLLTSRILGFLGTFGGFLFQSAVNFMSLISMLFGFGFFTTVMAKNNFEVAAIVSKNAYEASYYAFRHGTQRALRELFEGLVAPAGAIMGTLMLLMVRMFFVEKDSIVAINMLLVMLPAFVLSISVYMQNGYTKMVKLNLAPSQKKITRLHAIEILAQKGHGNSVDILTGALREERDADICVKIMKALKKIGDRSSIPAIEDCISSSDSRIAIKAINTISDFPGINKRNGNLMFTRRKLIEDLKTLFEQTEDLDVKTSIIRALSKLDENGVIFILDVLKNAEPVLKAECIKHMSTFNDPAVAAYLKPYLSSDDPMVRARAAAGMLKLKYADEGVRTVIAKLCLSSDKKDIIALCSVLWEQGDKKILKLLMRYLRHQDPEVRFHAAAGLLNYRHYAAAGTLADLLLDENTLILSKARVVLRDLRTGAKKAVCDSAQRAILEKAGVKLDKHVDNVEMLRLMGDMMLKRLKRTYELLDSKDDAELINTILEYRESLNRTNKVNGYALEKAAV